LQTAAAIGCIFDHPHARIRNNHFFVGKNLFLALLGILFSAVAIHADEPGTNDNWHALLASGQLVDIKKVDPTIAVELRYAGTNNVLGHPIYEPDMPCLARREVAWGLQIVQYALRTHGYGLKIWDAYRPASAQRELWKHFAVRHFVADPTDGRGSLHTWGLAVDLTVIDKDGKEIAMPSAFDNFTPAASAIYRGSDDEVHAHLRMLQRAMKAGGFIGLSTEWWHFAFRDWKSFEPLHWDPPTATAAVTPSYPKG
jgi:D-alanyl-D-alanine dipeptidase